METNLPLGEESDEQSSRARRERSMRYRFWRDRAVLAAQAVLFGVVAGFASFMFTQASLTPGWIEGWMAGAAILLTGAFVRLLVPKLKESVAVLLGAFFVGLAVVVAAWISPLWLLEYPQVVRDIILPGYVGRALLSTIITFPGTFVVGYLLGLLVDAFAFT